MSTAAPTVARSSSTSRRSVDRPQRAQSTTARPSGHAQTRHQQSALNNVARRDYEQSNVAQDPHARRSEEPARNDASRRGHSRYASDASTTSAMPSNGVAADGRGQVPANTKRRTTITAPSTGTWALGKTIGAGSMGKVKLAKHQETGEQVAVKIVPRLSQDQHQSAADRERADHSKEVRTAREAAIVSLLNHPYICGMRDVVRTNYHWYMLFEFVNGGQMLDYIISHGRLKEKQARKFARQIASALDYCHRNSIVHRDLKIENILISKTGDIKIIDFGLSNLFSPRNQLKTFCGSLYFAAPELLQAKQYTGPEVDVWSFGIVLYVLVCGKVPFDDQSMPQLHAKIKKGHVDYPPWLSAECRNLIHRMLQTDPTQRLTLSEIMSHPWLTKGFNSPPENYLPHREPLQLPLDKEIVDKMTGFDFGTAEYITSQLTNVIQSDEYQRAVRVAARRTTAQTPEAEKKRGMFDFYKRRTSISSREQLTISSSEDIQRGLDPVNAYSPLLSVYFLVKEKRDRERQEANPGAVAIPQSPGEKPLKMPDLPAPPAAYTNSAAYEMAGEKPTGGRSRPRARTHGEDEITDGFKRVDLNHPPGGVSPAILPPPIEQAKKEGGAVGLLRRFSTRKYRSHDRDRSEAPPPPTPAVAISGPPEVATSTSNVPRKSFSIRRPRERDTGSTSYLQSGSAANQPELLSPPSTSNVAARKFKALGRSTSVNSADLRRRLSRRGRSSEDPGNPPPTSGSDRSDLSGHRARPTNDTASDDFSASQRPAQTSRAKSLGHARRESIQARRAKREQAKEAGVPEETDAELAEAQVEASRSPDAVKPVFLKGLFSVSTTSTRPLSYIQDDLIRVLDQLGVDWSEIKGGFRCRHSPSIDMKNMLDPPASPPSGSHRRRISFGGLIGGDKDRDTFRDENRVPHTPKSRSRPSGADRSYTNTDESDASEEREERRPRRPVPAGETSTHVQNDMGENMSLVFEILIVKVPLLTLHGIQFKKVDGGTWQYKNMAQTILSELNL
ncbi:serine/threonine protein kinase-like protein Kin1 [Plenodomus tracheiphilus IPT5]|uniref:non-specific serine/threonine protein kinase n=1 Tax=Plenodomus tracheiphilus IPT5 TaxID=1408161 RepID=A0A6A7BL44_9PLEO|nr:serine/threonine protein kinase-like protein Kin1 [Plenodomus tracheiphilus IPT5]